MLLYLGTSVTVILVDPTWQQVDLSSVGVGHCVNARGSTKLIPKDERRLYRKCWVELGEDIRECRVCPLK